MVIGNSFSIGTQRRIGAWNKSIKIALQAETNLQRTSGPHSSLRAMLDRTQL